MDSISIAQAIMAVGWFWAQAHAFLDRQINDFFVGGTE